MSHEGKKALTEFDLLEFEFVSDPQLSPDGTRVAYVRTVIDKESNDYRSQIFVVPFEGGTPQPYTAGLGKETHPRWSPDGKYLAFLTQRESAGASAGDQTAKGKKKSGAQLYLLPTSGGEARCITDIESGVNAFVWSPDGAKIAFTSNIEPDGPKYLSEARGDGDGENGASDASDAAGTQGDPAQGGGSKTGRLDALFKKFNEDVRHITRPSYRLDGVGWFENKRQHVFLLDLEEVLAQPPGKFARPKRVTYGDFDHGDPAISPDGQKLVVVSNRDEDADRKPYDDLYLYDLNNLDPGLEPVKLTQSDSRLGSPAFSPDGSQIAYLGGLIEPYRNTAQTQLWVVPTDGSAAPRLLSASFDRSLVDESITDMRVGAAAPRPIWSADGSSIYLGASDRGTTHLYRVDVTADGGRVHRLTSGEMVIYGWSVLPALGKAAFAIATPENPGNIFVAGFHENAVLLDPASHPAQEGGLALTRVTSANDELLSQRHVSLPERFTFSAEGGPEVDGWVIKPIGWEEGKKYPAVLEIHGGPMAMYSVGFFLEFQLLAAKGIGVIFTNPRGSEGYGQEFCAAIMSDWGNRDYADLMAGVDAALARFDWIDPDRLGVAGGSYGGYMTSWIIGHTDRFKAACVMRPVTNLESMLASDIGFWVGWAWAAKKDPWEDPGIYRRQSPITYAGSMRTPTLIICKEQDYRCPTDQSEQLYTALQKQGVEVEYLRYPGESHGMSRSGKPWHRVHRLKHIVEWFERHLVR